MKKILFLLVAVMVLSPLFAGGNKDASGETGVYPDGDIVVWSTGQPQFRHSYYQGFVDRNSDIAPNVEVKVETLKSMADGQQRVAMFSLAGDQDSLPEIIMLDSVGIVELSSAGLLKDITDFYKSVEDQFIPGSANDATVNGRVYGLPDAVRPQLLFYNAEIFEKYDVDPAMMDTFEGYKKAGELLKERSNGEVFLSYVDPGSFTWRYWGRRGLMPQAEARIWDKDGNVVIGSDEGAKRALGYFDELYQADLLYKTAMMQQPLYEATDEGKIATYYIGAFWDEFLRKNLTETAGDWRAMPAPVFEEIGTRGAPVSTSFCIVDTGSNEYQGLLQDLVVDFQTNLTERNKWVEEMDRLKGPYSNPVSIASLSDPFWQLPSDFYGGQSFRQIQSEGLDNPSKNMTVTSSDAEADKIISAEIERYVAGEQSMNEAIANMDKELKIRIKKAEMP